ncbi:MAG: ribosomal-processing cysteine protease Prp [Lachnospiraceae bacterium]|nr:ribosomal-processing cysteine protease Prp [Lachnospiraceae bacterium]
MIRVTVFQDSGGQAEGITCVGHAGYGQEGTDIVCAAVSALVLNMANSVERFTDDGFEGQEDEEAGSFTFRFTGKASVESRLLMDSLILGLSNIREAYGEEYIAINVKEV